jgi:hypothetical protein
MILEGGAPDAPGGVLEWAVPSYEVTREVVRANERTTDHVDAMSARASVHHHNYVKLLSLARSLTQVEASITLTDTLTGLGLPSIFISRFHTPYGSFYNLVTRTKFSINLMLLLLFARLPTRHHQQDKNFLPEYMLEAPENLFVLNICILPYLDDIVVLFYYSRTTL